MSKANEPAFPTPGEQRYTDPIHGVIFPSAIVGNEPKPGLTKLEYMALDLFKDICKNGMIEGDDYAEKIATRALNEAAALIAELEKHHE